MKKIEQIQTLPDWDWTEHSHKEIVLTGPSLIDSTDFIWQIGNSVVAGFVYHNLLSPPWMWFILTKHVSVGDLLDFRRLAKLIPLGTFTAVQADYEKGVRFAELYDFVPIGYTHYEHGIEYELYRKS